MRFTILFCAVILAGCATASKPMETVDGSFVISAAAAPARGGSAGAVAFAQEKAQEFCSSQGKRALLVDGNERDVAQGGFTANQYGALGGTFQAGRAHIKFICR